MGKRFMWCLSGEAFEVMWGACGAIKGGERVYKCLWILKFRGPSWGFL